MLPGHILFLVLTGPSNEVLVNAPPFSSIFISDKFIDSLVFLSLLVISLDLFWSFLEIKYKI